MQADSVKVLYIAGSGRSGSTLLDNILGQIDGFFSVGELRYIWERGFVEGRLCGCGELVRRCPFWRQALADAFGDPRAVDPRRMMALQQLGTRVRHVPRMVVGGSWGRKLVSGMAEYPAAMSKLYTSIGRTSGRRVVVDSSKLPAYGYVVSQMPEVDLRVLHLVRDPRATSYSWLRKKEALDREDGVMQRQGPIHAAALWTVWNWTAQKLWEGDDARYLRMRYEDFVRSPRPSVERIVSFLDEPAGVLPFIDHSTVTLAPTHTVAGNPGRFTAGNVELRSDDEWMTKMAPTQRLLVTSLTTPLLRRYGYSVRVPEPDA